MSRLIAVLAGLTALAAPAAGQDAPDADAPPPLAEQAHNTWVMRSPLPSAPRSPRKGYESSWAWDPFNQRIIRHGGHNQGGGGAQYFEVWTLDPATMEWQLRQPNTSPPGVCCEKDNVFDPAARRFVRFPAFSNSHGWQWLRMIHLRNSSVWTYDNAANRWRNMRPLPNVAVVGGRCAAYDRHNDVTVVFGKHPTRIYDLYTNTWTRPKPAREPANRTYGSMVYDAGRRRFILFGRHYGNDPQTWVYDIRKNEWTGLKTDPHPPGNRTSPVMAYDGRDEVILCVLRTDKDDGSLQTWLFDCRGDTWRRLEPAGRDLGAGGNRNRLMLYLPEQDAFVFENRARKQQQIWTFRWRPENRTPRPGLPAPGQPRAVTTADRAARLSWEPVEGAAGYRLFRGVGQTPWQAAYAPIGPERIEGTTYTDEDLPRGRVHYYRVAALDARGKAGDESIPARTQPRVMDYAVVSVLGPDRVEVSWEKHPAEDVVGYNVYRADVEALTADQCRRTTSHEDLQARTGPAPIGRVFAIGPFRRLNAEPIAEATRYLDQGVDLSRPREVGEDALLRLKFYSKPFKESKRFDKEAEPYRFGVYAYQVTAVNALGIESGRSPWLLTVPGAVEGVFSREDGEKIHLKWEPRPEKNLRGYHVYRMNGRYVRKSKVSRLTDEPIRATTFTDENGGKRGRRYFVVAVDALGQEGVPSSPVWSYREWRKYYKPFGAGVGTWHQ
jgi:hypothetical protein